jgi:hypothetical protein
MTSHTFKAERSGPWRALWLLAVIVLCSVTGFGQIEAGLHRKHLSGGSVRMLPQSFASLLVSEFPSAANGF